MSPEEVLAYLIARTSADPTTGCWVWNQAPGKKGYAVGKPEGKTVNVHRWAYYALRGMPPVVGEVVHHTNGCGRTPCVYPGHLQATGGPANTAEMLERRGYLARIAQLELVVAGLVWILTQEPRS